MVDMDIEYPNRAIYSTEMKEPLFEIRINHIICLKVYS
jgi:hypothetical protein